MPAASCECGGFGRSLQPVVGSHLGRAVGHAAGRQVAQVPPRAQRGGRKGDGAKGRKRGAQRGGRKGGAKGGAKGAQRGRSPFQHEQDEGHLPSPRRTQLSPILGVTDFPKLYFLPFQPLTPRPTPEPSTTHASLTMETTGADRSPDQHDRFLARQFRCCSPKICKRSSPANGSS